MSHTKVSRLARALAAMALIGFAACGGSSDSSVTATGSNNNPLGSTFSATLTGGAAGSYSGYTSAVVSGGLFSIGMASVDGKFALAFTRSGTRPAVGTYQLGTNPLTGFTAALNVNAGAFVYSATSGTLTITSSSSSEVKGTFSFTGMVAAGSGAATNATGSFTAACPVSTGC